jgi:uncharacterized protein YceK
MTRRILLLLIALLLAGCVDSSASYFIDGREHALTLRAEQAYFWNDEVNLKLITTRLPDCQRALPLASLPAAGLDLMLYANGDNVYTLRAGAQAWRIDTQGCTLAPAAQAEPGELLGAFRLDADDKMVFEKAAPPA